MQISKHFTLEELLHSDTATRLGFTEQDNPSQSTKSNLQYLAEKVLDPIRDKFGPFTPNSTYRCGMLNNKVGGSKNSFHLIGCASDINLGKEKNRELFNWIQANLEFTELINEYDFKWVHVAIQKGRENEKAIKVIG